MLITALCFLLSLSADIQWVEADVSLLNDGRADFIYKVHYYVSSGELHGFYLEGISVTPYFDYKGSNAVTAAGVTYPLDINSVGSGKWDVILADGRGFGPGGITYIVHFGGDLALSQNLAKTKSDFGELVVLHWAPAQFDEPLEHYTIYVHYPIPARGEDINPDDFGFRTEKFMNENYLLSYYGQEYQGESYFTVRIHKNNLAAHEEMMIQQYVPASYFTTDKFGTIDYQPVRKRRFSIPFSEFLYLIIGAIPYLFYSNRKAKVIKGAYSEVATLGWLRTDWVPPKIEISTFRKSGKVAKLDLVEAALLLDYPVNKILTILAEKLKGDGVLNIVSLQPVQIQVLSRPAGSRYYETAFLDAVKSDGSLDEAGLKSLLTQVVENVSAKAWDSDLDATKAYYTEKIGSPTPDTSLDEQYNKSDYFYYLGGRPWMRQQYFRDMEQGFSTYGEPIKDYSTFIRSDSCHSACYVHTACHDACHSACHSACVSGGSH